MDEWIAWSKLLTEYEDFVLFDMLKTGIQPFDRYSKTPIYCDYYHHEYFYLFSQYKKLQNIVDKEKKEDALKKRREKLIKIVNAEPDLREKGKLFPKEFELSWKYLSVNSAETAKAVSKRLENAIFIKEEVDKYFKNIKYPSLPKKLRPEQKCKKDCQKRASKLWDKDPTLTIPDMYDHDEIAGIHEYGYTINTFRKWVKELNPNRNPGRRPKKSK